jgi:hypothetical protein
VGELLARLEARSLWTEYREVRLKKRLYLQDAEVILVSAIFWKDFSGGKFFFSEGKVVHSRSGP